MTATRPDPFGLAAGAAGVLLALGVGLRLAANRLDGEPVIPPDLLPWWRRLSIPTPTDPQETDPVRAATLSGTHPDPAAAAAATPAGAWRRTAYIPPDNFTANSDQTIRLAHTLAAYPHTPDRALFQVELWSDSRRTPRLIYFWGGPDQLLTVPTATWPPVNTWPGLLAVDQPQDGQAWRDPDDTARTYAAAHLGAYCARAELVLAGDPWYPVDDGVHPESPPLYRQPPIDALATVMGTLHPARGEYLQAVAGWQPLPPHEVTQVRTMLAQMTTDRAAPAAYQHKQHLIGQGGPIWNVQVLLRGWSDTPARAETIVAQAAEAWGAYDGTNLWQPIWGPPAAPLGRGRRAARRWAEEVAWFDARCAGVWAPAHPMVLSSLEAGMLLVPPTSVCLAPNIRRQAAAGPIRPAGAGARGSSSLAPAPDGRPGLIDDPATDPTDAELDKLRARLAMPVHPERIGHTTPPGPAATGGTSLAATLGGGPASPAEVLARVLESFDADAIVTDATRGPGHTLYEIALGPRTKVRKVLDLEHDIKVAYGVPEVRIFAPIPGRPGTVGVEVPHPAGDRARVYLDRVLFPTGRPKRLDDDTRPPLLVGLGAGLTGNQILVDLAVLPHLLIAGATGSGKSVGLNVVVTSLIVRNTPDRVKLILIDTKQVEMAPYAGLSHLARPLVTTPDAALEALGWVVTEMERRYGLLRSAGVRHITAYNDGAEPTGKSAGRERLAYLIIVIDELADLMMAAADHDDETIVRRRKRIEDAIVRVAQKARAVGIHLVIATQRPTADVVTGLISANIPARVAYRVAKNVDSRVALDQGGAEKLSGGGDLLYLDGQSSTPARVQGSWISDTEVEQVVARVIARDTPPVPDASGQVG